ncbi:RabGAP/TBC [Testicularia cyperi]|uniref:RabGAP/TBC n=1 Tax=Testicularia cyperi TaxID=1882483 RepID=A0A317XWC1_9BASI|nr:RabGAP/TBC [Testicularia cyperi]
MNVIESDQGDSELSPSSGTSAGPSTGSDPSNSIQQHTLLWSKSKVYVHPSPYAKHNVPGYLALVRQGPSRPGATILLSFLPESLVEQRHELEKFVRIEYTTSARANDDDSGEQRRSLDTVETDDDLDTELIAEPPVSSSYAFSLPIPSIYSFTIKTPTISSWYGTVTISQTGGVTLPTLHFHDDESKSTILSMHRAKASTSAVAIGGNGLSSSYDARLSAGSNGAGPSRGVQRSPSPSPTWGGDELVHQLRRYANVFRSALDPALFLVNPSRSDLEVHSTPMFDDDAIDFAVRPSSTNGDTNGSAFELSSAAGWRHEMGEDPFSMSPLHQSLPGRNSPRRNNDLAMDNLTVWAKNARMSVLSSFANLTQQARHASHAVLSHPLAKPYVPHLPGPVQSFAQAGPIPLGPNDGEWEWRTSNIANKSGTGEYYDSARVYLAKWARLVAEEGERNRRKEERLGIATGDGADGGNRHDTDQNHVEGSELGAFEVLEKIYDLPRPISEREARFNELAPQFSTDAEAAQAASISLSEWQSLFDPSTGRALHTSSEIRHRVFINGLTDEARKEAWPFLLGAVPFDSTTEERKAMWRQRELEYHGQKALWQTDDELLETEPVREQQHRVRVDCLRTDRNQPMFARDKQLASDVDPSQDQNPHTAKLGEILLTYGFWEAEVSRRAAEQTQQQSKDAQTSSIDGNASTSAASDTAGLLSGYVQGMSDLCSPLYIICDGDEVRTFWCFVGLMERTKSNFYRDQSGMKFQLLLLQKLISLMDPALYAHLERTDSLNLFFCFRWLLVRFKREFGFQETLGLWECCWAAEPCSVDSESLPSLDNDDSSLKSKSKQSTIKASRFAKVTAQVQGAPSEEEWGPTRSFHLFCALALLELHRDYLMRYLENFDEILQYFNSLTGEFNANQVINKAEILAKSFREIASTSKRVSSSTTLTSPDNTHPPENKDPKDYLDILTASEIAALL